MTASPDPPDPDLVLLSFTLDPALAHAVAVSKSDIAIILSCFDPDNTFSTPSLLHFATVAAALFPLWTQIREVD
jgi:hypothetical protein